MAQYETFQSNAAQIPIMRKWLVVALILSLLAHAGLLVFFHFKQLDNFGYSDTERLAPPIYKLKQVSIPEMPQQETKPDLTTKKPLPKIEIPDSKPVVEEVKISPRAPVDSAPLVQEKPKVDLSGFDALEKNQSSSLASLEKQLDAKVGGLVDQSVKSPRQPVIKIPIASKPGEGGAGEAGSIPGRLTIDEALNRNLGPVGNRAVAMQGGALFEWGKAELVPEAVQSLQKLGLLIKRNSKATFLISGHTDHTGTHDGNLILSQQRADAVRDWLVANFGIDPARITTIGKADDEAFPELGPEKSIDEQAPNRRVEIVIRTNRK
jgi:outer membrane protein OmpA-like peptidoglycan-associated protein